MTENDTLPPPPTPPPPTRPPLRRSRSQNVVGGVCGGIAEHTGIDALLFRVAFVVLVFAGGAGLLLYAALWLLLPDADGHAGPLRRWIDDRPASVARNVGIALVALVVLAIIVDASGIDGGLLALAALAVLAYLWSRDRQAGATPATAHVAAAWVDDPTVGTGPLAATKQPGPRRPRSRLGAITVSLLLVVLGALAIADRTADLSVSTAGYLAAALGVVGAGLLVGTFWGRSRGLIFLGIPLLAVLIPVSTLQVDLQDGVGERAWTVATVEELRGEYRLGAGYGRLDLTDVDFAGADATTELTVNVGYAEVLLPPDVDVTIRSEVRGGEIDLFGNRYDGRNFSRSVSDDGADGPGGGDLVLVVDVNLGVLEVDRVR